MVEEMEYPLILTEFPPLEMTLRETVCENDLTLRVSRININESLAILYVLNINRANIAKIFEIRIKQA
jgi:hypothetical protein